MGDSQAWSEDYHDYVFRKGKFLGDFENMYCHAKGVPWDQDKRWRDWYTEVGMLLLKERAPYESILEIGCGLGYVTARLAGFAKATQIDAFDISPSAIERARALHPGPNFYVDDITKASFRPPRQYGLVVVREVFWYLYDDIRNGPVIFNIDACVSEFGFLYIGQSFPALDRPFIGKDVIPTPEALLALFAGYEPIYTATVRNHELVNDGPILHYFGRKVT